jgi:hypothetical protein
MWEEPVQAQKIREDVSEGMSMATMHAHYVAALARWAYVL